MNLVINCFHRLIHKPLAVLRRRSVCPACSCNIKRFTMVGVQPPRHAHGTLCDEYHCLLQEGLYVGQHWQNYCWTGKNAAGKRQRLCALAYRALRVFADIFVQS